MDEGEVPVQALNSVGREVRARSSALYKHRVEFRRVRPGKNSMGGEAWVAEVYDRTVRRTLCVRVWATTALTIRTYNSEIDACDLESDPAPAGPGGGEGPPQA